MTTQPVDPSAIRLAAEVVSLRKQLQDARSWEDVHHKSSKRLAQVVSECLALLGSESDDATTLTRLLTNQLAEIAAVKAEHIRISDEYGPWSCKTCDLKYGWPCPTARALEPNG